MVLYRVYVWSGLLACPYKVLSPLVASQSVNQFTMELERKQEKGKYTDKDSQSHSFLLKSPHIIVLYWIIC